MRALFLISLLLIMGVGACRMEVQSLSGRISVAGNEPFTYVRLVDAQQHEYRLVGEKAERIRRTLQGREVELRGRVVKQAVGPGEPAEFQVDEVLAR